jgi:hypothetical protein
VRVIFDIELLVKEVLNLLFLPRLSFAEEFDEFLLLGFVELRGRRPRSSASVYRVRPRSTDGSSYWLFFPTTNVVSCPRKRSATVQELEKDKPFVNLDVVSLS